MITVSGKVLHEALWPPLGLLGLLVAWAVPLDRLGWFCPFHRLTGLPCVACGGTRAVVAFAHGRVLEALALNPLVTLGLGAFVLYCAYAVVALSSGLRFRPVLVGARATILRVLVLVVLSLNWAYLIVAGR